MSAPKPIEGILNITPYKGGDSALEDGGEVIKLSSNETPLGPSPRAIEAVKAMAGDLHRYPDGGANDLRGALAGHYGLDRERLVCSNGSDELIAYLTHAYAGPGDEVLYSEHGFLMYPLSAMAAGATPVKAPESDMTASVDNLLAAVTARTRIVFLANPNNPTGTYLPLSEVRRLREGLREDVLLVVDAAYAEYVSRNDYEPGVELVDAFDNVVMTRTFSKIYGLAALRLGWAYCPQAIADVYNRVRSPFNVNAAAQAAGCAALADVAHTDKARAHNDQWLPWLTAAFEKHGFAVIPSVGNFISVRFPDAAAALGHFNAAGILPRAIAGYGMAEHLRFTIGTAEENRAVAEAARALAEAADG